MRDPEIPRYLKKAVRKKYGIQSWSRWFKRWCFADWYTTAKARDQAFKNLTTKTSILNGTKYEPRYRKVNR